jgi:hypothetical protein
MGSFYKQEGGKFHLFNDVDKTDEKGEKQTVSELTHSSEQVVVAWCRIPDQQNRVHVFTHGTMDGMQKWVEAHNSHSPHKAQLKVFDQSAPIMTINRAISDMEFFATLV